MIDSHLAALAEGNHIANLLNTLINRSDVGDIIIVLESIYDCLKSLDVLVHLLAHSLESLECRPGRNLDLSAVAEDEDYIIIA